MKILIGCLHFSNFGGSEIYVFEISRALQKIGFEVVVASQNIGTRMTHKAALHGINCVSLSNIPDINFDLIFANHNGPTEFLLNKYPNTPFICGIHSEIIREEEPVIHPNIKKYIAIRPQIKTLLINHFNISENKIELIYNPFDTSRFNKKNNLPHPDIDILFVGNNNHLRNTVIQHLIQESHFNQQKLTLLGSGFNFYKNINHVDVIESLWNTEQYIQRCKFTAGIMLGRSTIEGWLCGKPGWIYDVNNRGQIISKELFSPPENLNVFNSNYVAKQISSIIKNL
jgi:glycosyltransferase involved in cell wall biosynthesis